MPPEQSVRKRHICRWIRFLKRRMKIGAAPDLAVADGPESNRAKGTPDLSRTDFQILKSRF